MEYVICRKVPVLSFSSSCRPYVAVSFAPTRLYLGFCGSSRKIVFGDFLQYSKYIVETFCVIL